MECCAVTRILHDRKIGTGTGVLYRDQVIFAELSRNCINDRMPVLGIAAWNGLGPPQITESRNAAGLSIQYAVSVEFGLRRAKSAFDRRVHLIHQI